MARAEIATPAERRRLAEGRRLAGLEDAANYSGVCTKTIRRRIASGDLTGYRFGPRLIRVDLNELDAMLEPIPSAGSAA